MHVEVNRKTKEELVRLPVLLTESEVVLSRCCLAEPRDLTCRPENLDKCKSPRIPVSQNVHTDHDFDTCPGNPNSSSFHGTRSAWESTWTFQAPYHLTFMPRASIGDCLGLEIEGNKTSQSSTSCNQEFVGLPQTRSARGVKALKVFL